MKTHRLFIDALKWKIPSLIKKMLTISYIYIIDLIISSCLFITNKK